MKYKDWLNEWLEYKIKPTTKQRTYEKYRMQINRHIVTILGEYDLTELLAIILQKFTVALSEKKLSPSTINGIISVVKHSLRSAVAFGVVDKQCSDSIIRPKNRERKIECFSKEEQRKIERYVLKKSNPKLFGIVLCLYTGLRIGELLALKWEDVDFIKGIISVSRSCHDSWENGQYVKVIDTPKTECSVRVIPIAKQLITHLKLLRRQNNGDFVIIGKNEYGTQIRSYQRTFETILKKLKITHKGFHSLRHTFATRALECGMDVKTLSELLGHQNPNVTLHRYVHSLMEHKQEMMNKLGKLLQ